MMGIMVLLSWGQNRDVTKKMSPAICAFEMGYTINIYDNWLVVTGTMEFYDFPFSWECQFSQLTIYPSFFRGVGIPPTRY